MSDKEKIIAAIKANHGTELLRADKWLDLQALYPIGANIIYKGEPYRIIAFFAYSSYTARPFTRYINHEDINLMNVGLDEISLSTPSHPTT